MRASVIVFPGTNRERDIAEAITRVSGKPCQMVWHGDTSVPKSDLIVLPGGFSYGDYLRTGAMAAHSPIMKDVIAKAKAGTAVLGVCNGFQMLCETQLLPGVLMRNASLKFVCRDVHLRVENAGTMYTNRYQKGDVAQVIVAHGDGNYFADPATLDRLDGENRVAFRYCDRGGTLSAAANPNGSQRHIAGIVDASGRILGMMPHPENACELALGSTDGLRMFESIVHGLVAA
jgi:phosphoribosylformylglycinamidine synthase subunit PurQ / glutaminase